MKGAVQYTKFSLAVLASAVLLTGIFSSAAFAQDTTDPRHNCRCSNTTSEVCTQQGFKVKLVDFSVDQNAGTSSWHYQVCNEAGLDTGCTPPLDLEHVAIGLPLVGDCLTAEQEITVAQTGGFSAATMSCQVLYNDPTCVPQTIEGRDWVAQCDVVAPSNLDGGECVDLTMTISGEMPTLGGGAALTIMKQEGSPDCARNCVLGPSCWRCVDNPPPPDDHDCITRTKGFWGTHPHITQLYTPVTVCGETLSVVEAGTCDSVTEALCVAPGNEARKKTNYANLVSQLAAAKLNLNATAALEGSCGEAVANRIAECEALCGAGERAIKNSGCIQDITAFNEAFDTVGQTTPPFDRPGPANPEECQEANGNGIVIGIKSCL